MQAATDPVGYEPDEIVVTPAMIDAGEAAFLSLSSSYPDRELVKAVYNAMERARLRASQ